MGLAADAAKARAIGARALDSLRGRRAARALLAERPTVPDGTVEAVVYFPDLPENLYQVDQWYEPMRRLDERHRVVVVTRKWGSTARVLPDCPVPVVHCDTIEAVERFLDRQRVRVVFYVNQNQQNFPAMRFADPAHVFVCHGESDKDYMSSNQLKAYDHVFVAGRAARERIRAKLIGFDETHLVEVGRPQVDVHEPSPVALPDDGRTVVLYAPTTEGDVPSMRYSSVAGHGVALARSLLASGRHRLVYRPHPRLGLTVPAYREAHEEVLRLIDAANRADAGARHVADTSGPFGWQVDAAHVCVTDVSAVAYDWLATGKPLVVTRPSEPRAVLPQVGLVQEIELLDAADAGRAADVVDGAVRHPGDAHAALVERYFGDTTPGASMGRFLDACDAVIRGREEALVERAARPTTGRR
ncbi:CDP-glycerol glycerophosphotransferase family protein [Fodinibacter luteus]|uniref:CDP-glycerol glycerophosphotransferase family protein n=1 Tax=Fodinibacter luteus TaxID=552064 RepID=A0ABP8K2A5_9MICO